MKKTIIVICCSIAGLSMQAQNLDSLYSIWKDNTKPAATRAKAYYDYVWDRYLYSNPDTAEILAKPLHTFAQTHHFSRAAAMAYNLQGVANAMKGNYPIALDNYKKSLEIDERNGYKKGITGALNNIGNIYLNQGNYPQALDYYHRSLKIYEEIIDKNGIALILNNIGNIYSLMKDYPRSLEYQLKSLAVCQEIADKRGAASAMSNIGNAYLNMKNYPLALDYFKKALGFFEETGDKTGMAINYVNIGRFYEDQGDYSRALEYSKKSLALNESMGAKQQIATDRINIGRQYKKLGKYTVALDYCHGGLLLAKEVGALKQQKAACECIYETHKANGQSESALEYHEQMIRLGDSINNSENTRKIIQLDMQYAFDKKEAIAKAEQEKKDAVTAQELRRQKLVRNGFIGGFAVVLLFAVIFLSQRNRISKEKKRSEELLLNILPEETAKELKEKGHSDAQLIDHATVLFTDFEGFTALSEKVTPKELVADLHACFSLFDKLCEKYGIEKIKTIGDAYMAAGGLPTPHQNHARYTVQLALEMATVVQNEKNRKTAANLPYFDIRIGVHTGPVVAGIVGIKKFQYDIWGDTVNTASRMETSGVPGKVNISQSTYEQLKDDPEFSFISRGKIQVKGKGEMEMYFVSRA